MNPQPIDQPEVPQEGQLPVAPILSAPAPQTPTSEVPKKKKKHILVIVLILLFAVVIWQWDVISFFAKFGYYYVTGQNSSSTSQVATFTPPQVNYSLEHKTPLDTLGITIGIIGNAADDFLNYFGSAPIIGDGGVWNKKYGASTSSDIALDAEDINYEIKMGSATQFSLYPEHFPIPNPPSVSATLFNIFDPSHITKFGRGSIVVAKNLESTNPQQAEKILDSLLVLGREMQESQNITTMQWVIGQYLEDRAATELAAFYKSTNNPKASTIAAYSEETKNLKDMFSQFTSNVQLRFFPLTAVAVAGSHLSRDALDAALKAAGGSLQEIDNDLEAFDSSEPVIQGEGILGLIILRAELTLEPEHTKIIQILEKYKNSKSDYIRNLATYGLATNPEQVIRDFQKLGTQ